MDRLIPLCGLVSLVGTGYLLSSHRKSINWRTVLTGIFIQILTAFLILKTTVGIAIFDGIRVLFTGIVDFSLEGARFLFGNLMNTETHGFVFAFFVLPAIIFVSSLMSFCYHIGLMQIIIRALARVMVRAMGTSGGESLACAANIFAGQAEAPLAVLPLLKRMTRSELMALMTGGMATVAGGVLAACVGLGIDAGHLLAASVMSAPAALVCAKLMVPEREKSETMGLVRTNFGKTYTNWLDALTVGATDGLRLALNVAAMLIAFVALVALVNATLHWFGALIHMENLNLEFLLGHLLAPVAFLLGVPWEDCLKVGFLLGEKIVLNEFVAYLHLREMMNEGALSERAIVISTYALCGFANFGSVAVQIGGIGALVPERREDLSRLGMRSLIGGTLACFMTAAVAALLL